MRRLNKIFSCFMLIPIFGQSAVGSDATPSDSGEHMFRVYASVVERRPDDIVVRFSVKNITSRPITIYSAFLPWESPVAMRLVLIPLQGSGQPLDQLPSIEDPIAATTILPPGERIEGNVSLRKHFQNLKLIPISMDAALFWALNVFSADNNATYRYIGTVEIPASPPRGQ